MRSRKGDESTATSEEPTTCPSRRLDLRVGWKVYRRGVGTYRISELAGRTGLPATTLRYYEKERLLPAHRTPAGYRMYNDADVDRVQFISAAKHLGLPLEQIRDLLAVWDGGLCAEIRDELRPMVATQIAAADQRIQDLQTFRERLRSALTHLHDLPANDGPCDPACAFPRDLPDRVPARDRRPRPATPSPVARRHADRRRRGGVLPRR